MDEAVPYSFRFSDTDGQRYLLVGGQGHADLIVSMIKKRKTMRNEKMHPDDKRIYQDLFKPSRGEISSNMGSFLKANMNVAKELIKSKFVSSDIELSELALNQRAVMRVDGKKLAVFRDENGEIFTHSAVCPHMGCGLEYNDAEKSFDCPFHGSRFTARGTVIEDPALKDLKEEDIL